MKLKAINTVVLLLFVAASVVALIVKETRKRPVTARAGGALVEADGPCCARMFMPAPPTVATASNKVIAYYFHGNVRCMTCRKLEALSHEALQTGFAAELQSGRLEWRVVNLDETGNEHFVQDYQLETRSLVLVDFRDGKQARWNNLKRIWDLVSDDRAFVNYVQDETRTYLESH